MTLTQEKLKELLNYDPLTGIFTWKVRMSNRVKSGDIAGCIRTNTSGKKYHQIRIYGNTCQTHRLAVLYVTGEWPVHQVDHEDGNGLHNWWSNLRDVTQHENQKNVRLSRANKSGFTGVRRRNGRGKWIAAIGIGGKDKHLGCFSDKQEAINARIKANISLGFHKNHGAIRPL